jgi:cytochrome P450
MFTFGLAPAGRMTAVCEPSAALRLLEQCPRAGEANADTLPAVLAARSVFFAGDGESRHRRALHRGWLDAALSAGTEQRLVEAVDRSVRGWPAGRPFPLLPRMKQILAQALSPLLADVPGPGAQRDLAAAASRLITPLAMAAATALGPHPATRPLAAALLNRHRREFGRLVFTEIRRRQAGLARPVPADALGAMLAGCDSSGHPFSAAGAGDELASLLVALVDVQAVALTWAFERLARYPDIAGRLRAASAAGDTAFAGAVADEALRTRPPVIGAFRTLDIPYDLDGTHLPAGARAMAAIPLIHRHPGTWPDPGPTRGRSGRTGSWTARRQPGCLIRVVGSAVRQT